jgi:hypothetical protein
MLFDFGEYKFKFNSLSNSRLKASINQPLVHVDWLRSTLCSTFYISLK